MDDIRTARRRRLTVGALALLAGAAPACGSSTAPPDVVALPGTPRRVVIRNHTRAPMFTFVVGRHAAALVNWHPCVDVACAPIPAGHRAVRPVVTVQRDILEVEAVVYWWHAVGRADGTMGPDSVRHVVVELH